MDLAGGRAGTALRSLLVLASLVGAGLAHADEAAELALGKKVFTETANPKCATCHTLKDAGTQGMIGPVLDELQPTAEQVATATRDYLPPAEAAAVLQRRDLIVAHFHARVRQLGEARVLY